MKYKSKFKLMKIIKIPYNILNKLKKMIKFPIFNYCFT